MRNEILVELINGKVYCNAAKNIFANNGFINAKTFLDVTDVFEHLAKNSIQVTDDNDEPVTPQVLAQESQFYVVCWIFLKN